MMGKGWKIWAFLVLCSFLLGRGVRAESYFAFETDDSLSEGEEWFEEEGYEGEAYGDYDPYAEQPYDPYVEEEEEPFPSPFMPQEEGNLGFSAEVGYAPVEDSSENNANVDPGGAEEDQSSSGFTSAPSSPWEDAGGWSQFLEELKEIRQLSQQEEEDLLASPEVLEAGKGLRRAMTAREEKYTAILTFPESSLSYAKEHQRDFYTTILSLALEETGRGKEGDYLTYHFYSCQGDVSLYTQDGELTLIIEYSLTYYDNGEQEEALNRVLPRLEEELGLFSDISAEEKVRRIYEYLASHSEYDVAHASDESYLLKYSAYAALIQQKSLCQGFSLLFYRMCLDAGIPCRILTGIALGETHMWNIVQLGEAFYHVDLTFDECVDPKDFRYFLKGEKSFRKTHERVGACQKEEFQEMYPVDERDYVPGSAPTPSLSLSPKVITLYEGEESISTGEISFIPLGSPSFSSLQVKVEDPSIASVSANGRIKARQAGRTTVKARLQIRGVTAASATCKLVVKKPVLRVAPITLTVGEEREPSYTCIPAGTPTLSIKNTSIATITEEGRIKALKKGKTKLVVSCHGLKVKVAIEVEEKEEEEVEEKEPPKNTSSAGKKEKTKSLGKKTKQKEKTRS